MKLFHENTIDYLAYCIEQISSQAGYLAVLNNAFARHAEPDSCDNCALCKSFGIAISENDNILQDYIDRLNRGKRGIYD